MCGGREKLDQKEKGEGIGENANDVESFFNDVEGAQNEYSEKKKSGKSVTKLDRGGAETEQGSTWSEKRS